MTAAPSRKELSFSVRKAHDGDLGAISRIGSESFSGLRPFEQGRAWVVACFSAYPRMEYWVAEQDSKVVGYILWNEKGGFRKDAVVELEQVAVDPHMRGRGVGGELVRKSLEGVQKRIETRGARVKVVEVTTGSEQHALEFYQRVLGAQVVAKIPDYFRGDEFILLSRRSEP